MVSFISVSNRGELAESLRRSIQASLGNALPWNLEIVDGNTHDIFAGYNAGAGRAKGDVLAFIHHDVVLLGNFLSFRRSLELVQKPETGFVGIAGAVRLDADGKWWNSADPADRSYPDARGMVLCPGNNEFGIGGYCWPSGEAKFGRALVVDGVLMFCSRRLFESLGGFDSATFKGFHFYDVDISLRAHLAGKINYVAPIPLLHASMGSYDATWDAARQIFLRKHGHILPLRLATPS